MSAGFVLLIIIVVILIIAWALLRNTKTPTPDLPSRHEEIEAVAPVVEARAPAPEPQAPSKPDDLTKLEGIGPKVNQVLNNAGIATFAQLATAKPGKLREILDAVGYQYMDPAGWIEQARLAAEGKFDELKELQSKLKGGRKVG